jgi:hypothetical protein
MTFELRGETHVGLAPETWFLDPLEASTQCQHGAEESRSDYKSSVNVLHFLLLSLNLDPCFGWGSRYLSKT